MAESLDVLRTEKKYILPVAAAGAIKARLSYLLPVDEFCRDQRPYLVKSLYFDSMSDRDYYQKFSGLENRHKIRLRTYGAGGTVKLEWKRKQGSKQRKQSLLVSEQVARALIDGSYRCLLEYDNDLARRLYAIMTEQVYRPKCLIQYERFAYAAATNDIRITLDSNISAQEGNLHLLSSSVPWYPVQSPNLVILEIKYNHFLLEHIQTALAPFGLSETASSKYVRGRYFSMGASIV